MRSTAVGFALAFIFGLSVLPIDAKKCKDLRWPGGSSLSGFENLPYTVILEIKSKTPLVTCLVIGADTIEAKVDPARVSFNNGQGVGYPSDRYTKVFNRDRCASGQFFDWARGHLMAARYFGHRHAATSRDLQALTYYTFNVIPMLQQCNNGWWKTDVEAAVRKYMNLKGTDGDRVFVGTFGEQPDRQFSKGMPAITATKSEEPQHRRIMWTAVCPKDGSGFYFVWGYPNNVDCGPHLPERLPKRSTIYANVVKQLEKECGGKSRSWQHLLVRPTAPSLAFGRSIPNAKSSPGPSLPQILRTSGSSGGRKGSRRGNDHSVKPKDELLPPIQLSPSASLGGGDRGLRDSALQITKAKKRHRMGDSGRFHPYSPKWSQRFKADEHGKMRREGRAGENADKSVYYSELRRRQRAQRQREERQKRQNWHRGLDD